MLILCKNNFQSKGKYMTQDELWDHYHDHGQAISSYIKMGYLENAEDVRALHQFFSPTCVPLAMTRAEVRMCVNFASLRAREKEQYQVYRGTWVTREDMVKWHTAKQILSELSEDDLNILGHDGIRRLIKNELAKLPPIADVLVPFPMAPPPSLPEELCGSEDNVMTREKFRTGILKFLALMEKTPAERYGPRRAAIVAFTDSINQSE
jgi:hypothetical protein